MEHLCLFSPVTLWSAFLFPLNALLSVHEHDAHGLQFIPDPVCFGPVSGFSGCLTLLDHGLHHIVQTLFLLVIQDAENIGKLSNQLEQRLGAGTGGLLVGAYRLIGGANQLEEDAVLKSSSI